MDKKTKKPGYYYINKNIFDKEYGFTINAKIVFCYLSGCANRETAKCFPSISMVAKACSICPSTVRKAIKELKENNFIKVEPQFREDYGQRCNTYTVF